MAKKKYEYTPVTVHDAKNVMIEFFENEADYRKNSSLLKKSLQEHKALTAFNKAIRNKRKELEDEIMSGKNKDKNLDLLQLKTRSELKLKPYIKDTLVDEYFRFRYNEFRLEEIPYFRLTNRIHFLSGKEFKFVIDCKFKKYTITRNKVLKMTKLSEENFAMDLIKLFKKGFEEQKELDKNSYDEKELKLRKRMYSKIEMVIAHNEAIASGEDYGEELYKLDSKGNLVKKNGQYPMMFELKEEIMDIYIP